MLDRFLVGVMAIGGALLLIVLVGVLTAYPIKWCWNYVMPYLFGLKVITWGQAWCLHFLAGSFIKASSSISSKRKS